MPNDSQPQLSPSNDDTTPPHSLAPETLDMMTRLADSDWSDDTIVEFEGEATTHRDCI